MRELATDDINSGEKCEDRTESVPPIIRPSSMGLTNVPFGRNTPFGAPNPMDA